MIPGSHVGGVLLAPDFSRRIVITASSNWQVPDDNSGKILVKAWGGGGSAKWNGAADSARYIGGGAGFVKSVLQVTQGESLIIRVSTTASFSGGKGTYGGGTGWNGGTAWAGGGGGYSGVFRSSVSQENALLVAAGGSGAGYAGHGRGGNTGGTTFSALQGRNGGTLEPGGGGGYWGGSVAGSLANAIAYGGTNFVTGTETISSAGSTGTPANTGDVDWYSPIGVGAPWGQYNVGGAGLVVIYY